MKTALVTGANRGIGFEVARQLATLGYHVFLCSRDRAKGEAATRDLQSQGLKVDFIELDVASEPSILAAAKHLANFTPQLDVLINNAGIASAETMDFETAVIRQAFETNALGPLLIIRAFTPLLEKSGHAQVVNVSTVMSQSSYRTEGSIAYRISKTALNAVTRITSNELYDQNIAVNAVCPGWVRTDMGGPQATRDVTKGAETILWLATASSPKSTGKFYRDKKEIEW